jgi:HK97 family phage prohead protease
MERKVFRAFDIKVLDEDQGIVESIIAVMGNVDEGLDVIHPNAFTKTISERGTKVKVLDQHQTDSVLRIVGKPLAMRELGRGELPQDILDNYPDATGALWAKTQFLLSTPEGKGVFERLKLNALGEWSIGYDPLDLDYSNAMKDGKKITVRNLRTLKLFEYSPCIWAMNQATSTLSAKSSPSEGKPWNVFKEDGKWCVYKVDEDGQPTGERLGEHDSEEEARAQVRALYANEGKDEKATTRSEGDGNHPAEHYLVVEDPEKPSTWHLRVRGMDGKPDHRLMGAAWAALHGGYRGNVYEGPGKQEAISKLRAMYASEDMDTPGEKQAKAGRRVRSEKIELLRQLSDIAAQLMKWAEYSDEEEQDTDDEMDAPEGAANKQQDPGAGPPVNEVHDAPTQSDLLTLIELEQSELDLLEI